MSLEKLKLSKPLNAAMLELGFLTPKEIQSKTISRILGGQDVVAVAPLGAGKTTAYVLATLMKLKYAFEEAPRALILVPDTEHMEEVLNQFNLLNRNKTMRILGIDHNDTIANQMNLITDGVDIIVAVPDRARALYLKLALNTNKIQLFIIDDAQLMIKKGLQLPITELANSAYKSQHLLFTEVLHDKIEKMMAPFMKMPAIIEIDELEESTTEIQEMLLYKLPDFKNKLYFLAYLLSDDEVFDKVLVFVENRLTAQKVYKALMVKDNGEVAIYNPLFADDFGFSDVEEFKQDESCRILIVASERLDTLDCDGIPFVIHLEVPEQLNIFTDRVLKKDEQESNFITLATDIELATVKRIEQALGKKMVVLDLPENFTLKDGSNKNKRKDNEEPIEAQSDIQAKKAKNTKTYNYSAGQKAKMTFKNKKG
ncbi:ATP-dependent RNA helicase RhlE [Pedobacter sp. UYP30]|uniref:DEAD/DEAH box helicase n=1 Tax=Pedobacter sp. UYP30 TaxID=1756400 RepID=UPI003399B341